MRLIDADALISKIWELHKKTEESYDLCVDELKDVYCGIVSLIDEQPTAYNVDMVVIQLDKASDCYGTNEQGGEHVQLVHLSDAINIVREGGKYDE